MFFLALRFHRLRPGIVLPAAFGGKRFPRRKTCGEEAASIVAFTGNFSDLPTQSEMRAFAGVVKEFARGVSALILFYTAANRRRMRAKRLSQLTESNNEIPSEIARANTSVGDAFLVVNNAGHIKLKTRGDTECQRPIE